MSAQDPLSEAPSGVLREARDYLRGMRRVAIEDGLTNMAEACEHVIGLIARAKAAERRLNALPAPVRIPRPGMTLSETGYFYPDAEGGEDAS